MRHCGRYLDRKIGRERGRGWGAIQGRTVMGCDETWCEALLNK